ncbi:MAG: site-2 protease family protein [Clostridia bacterium]|nr:site-2 protease family protein [Clostridia bacterium]
MFLLLGSIINTITYIGYILVAIFVLLLMITVHELGHYIAGKSLGFGIEEFSIGFGPSVFKKTKKSGEVFSLRAVPLGGYCAFVGEDKDSDSEKAFDKFHPLKRIVVLVSGVIMNYLFAVLLIVLMFGIYGQSTLKVYEVQDSDEVSAEYSLFKGDVILKVNGKNIYIITDLMNAIQGKDKGDTVDFKVMREGKETDVKVVLRTDTDFSNVEDIKTVFLSLGTYQKNEDNEYLGGGLYTYNVRLGALKTVGHSFEYSVKLGGTIFKILGQLITGKLGLSSMGGTITTIGVTANAVKAGGLSYLLYIASFIGVNLAVFNILPIPALDGSHVIFTLIEWIRKKPINKKIENIIHTIGFIFILLLAVIFDIGQCF